MLILSQDQSFILNFDNIESIEIGNFEENRGRGIIYARLTSDYFYTIGEYNTIERTKEVLQEIIEAYSKEDFYHIRKSELNNLDSLEEPKFIIKPVIRTKVYKMPEK